MKNIYDFIWEQLYFDEICQSKNNGCTLLAPGPVLGKGISASEILAVTQQNNIQFPDSLIEFYKQASQLNLRWEIFEGESGGRKDTSIQFKENSWLKENYLENGYSWEAVKILLSGNLNISKLKNIIDLDNLKATGMYQAAEKLGMKGGDLRPIDCNEYAVACMKVEDGKLIDNIYLYTGFGGFPEALHDMNVTFEQYLELAYKAKCFNYWNLTYCLKEKSPSYELMKRFLPVIFPHLTPDLEDFGINY